MDATAELQHPSSSYRATLDCMAKRPDEVPCRLSLDNSLSDPKHLLIPFIRTELIALFETL
jgi:hypothetical protein